MLILLGSVASCHATDWLTGPALREHLSDPIDLTWSENPVRNALANFAQFQNVAVLLDRRIDPSMKITLSLHQSPLSDSLAGIAMAGELGVTLAGPVAYFGPPDSVPKLRTLIFLREEEAKKMPSATGKIFFQSKSLAWDDFTEPRKIFEKLGQENHLAIAGLGKIPHDLWAAADLPPMTLAERLSLVAFQYDLTFVPAADGKRIELVPIPTDIRLTRSYPGGKEPEETVKKFAELAPKAEIDIVEGKIRVRGMLDDHERIEAARKPAGPTPAANADADLKNKRCTLTVTEKPIGPVLRQIAKQLDLQLQMDEAAIAEAGVSLDRLVSIKVKEVTIDEVLQAAIKDVPLQYRRQGNVVIIEARK
jgi:hypothetical protein